MCAGTCLDQSWHGSYEQAQLDVLHHEHSKQHGTVVDVTYLRKLFITQVYSNF